MRTRIIWDGGFGCIEYSISTAAVIPPVGCEITACMPLEGKLRKLTGIASKVSVDYSRDEIVIRLSDVDLH